MLLINNDNKNTIIIVTVLIKGILKVNIFSQTFIIVTCIIYTNHIFTY